MITTSQIHECPKCQSQVLIKNGHNAQGKQQYVCKACGRRGVLNPSVVYSAADKERIIAAYYERPSMRGIERIFGVRRQTLASWLEKSRRSGESGRHTRVCADRRPTRTG